MRTTIIILILCAFIFAACKDGTTVQNTSNSDAGSKPVSFHHYFSGTLGGGIEEMVDVYNQTQESFHLNVVPIDHEAYKINILESFDNNTPADMNSYWAGARTESVLKHLEPLDVMFEEKGGLKDKFHPSLLESSSIYNNHYYLMPITQHYVCFYYNKAVFDKYNLSEPSTWSEFEAICKKLKEEDVTPPIGLGAKSRWPAQFWFDYLLLRTAGNDYRQQLMSGEAKYTDDEVLGVMAIWKDLIDKVYMNDNAAEIDWDLQVLEPMMAGEYGMTLMGTWYFSILDSEGFDDQYGVFSFPLIDKTIPNASLGPVDGVVIGKKMH